MKGLAFYVSLAYKKTSQEGPQFEGQFMEKWGRVSAWLQTLYQQHFLLWQVGNNRKSCLLPTPEMRNQFLAACSSKARVLNLMWFLHESLIVTSSQPCFGAWKLTICTVLARNEKAVQKQPSIEKRWVVSTGRCCLSIRFYQQICTPWQRYVLVNMYRAQFWLTKTIMKVKTTKFTITTSPG